MKYGEKTINYFNEETNHNDLISKKHKKVCKTLDYIENLLILTSAVTGCNSTVTGIPTGVASSAVGLEISTITAEL